MYYTPVTENRYQFLYKASIAWIAKRDENRKESHGHLGINKWKHKLKLRPAGYNGILKGIIYLMELALSQDGKGWSKMSKTDAIWHINWLKEKKKKPMVLF